MNTGHSKLTLATRINNRLLSSRLFLHAAIRKHRKLCETSERVNNHTYTCFNRSPKQLEVLTEKALNHLNLKGDQELSINIFACSNGSEAYTIASELLHRCKGLKFKILASDLHQSMIDKASSATYTRQEVVQDLEADEDFINRTFDIRDDKLIVKDAIRQRISFKQADLLDESVIKSYPKADIVTLQNVLFHMPNPMARKAFNHVFATLKPRSILLIDGMDIEMRVELTELNKLKPLNCKVKEIYQYARRHVPSNWWDYYFGCEPYNTFRSKKSRRYGTIFLRSEPMETT